MATFETEGIVLKHFDLGEADKIITFYTKDNGKVRAVAKGARKAKSRISGLVLPFSYNQITIYKGRSLAKINHIENKYSFSELREDLLKMAYSSYIAEVSVKTGQEDHQNKHLFSLILKTFYDIKNTKNDDVEKLDLINIKFKAKLLKILGFKPELLKCVKCNKKISSSSENLFSIKDGGLICTDCLRKNDDPFKISGESLVVLRFLLGENKKLPKNIKISPKAFQVINRLIDQFIIYHLDINIKSEKFLHMIKTLG
ncbi:MAG: DNA repair protein RecO [Bacillota bacterium]